MDKIETLMVENDVLKKRCEKLQDTLKRIQDILEEKEPVQENKSQVLGELLFCRHPLCDCYSTFVDGKCTVCGHSREDGE